ncbi:MAG: MFS transporter [Chitinophagaceae bacterium]|nr:MFS transporter [Chitinophagaceae bacterium]MCB9046208.1 MFS transporter [Chitinophagales bacterium]
MTTKERILLLLLASLNFTHIMDFMIMMPLGNFLMPHFNISAQQFSLLVAAYTFSAAFASISAASFVDRFDRKKVLLFAYTGFLTGTLMCAIAPSYQLLLAARILAGLFGGLIGAQVLSIVADKIPFERRGMAMGIVMAAFSAASVFGVPFGLYLSKFFSWHAPFYFVAGVGIILIPLLNRYIPNMTDHLQDKSKQKLNPVIIIRDIIKDKDQRLAVLLSSTMMLGHFLIIPFLFPFMELNVGFSNSQTPLIYIVGGGLTIFTSPIIGRLADRLGKFKLFSYMILLAITPIALITNMPAIPFYFVLCITGFWFIVSTGRAIPAQAIVSEVVPPARRGSFMNINSAIQQMGVGMASLIAGLIVIRTPQDKIVNYNITGYLSISVILCCLYIGYLLHRAMKFKDKPVHNEHVVHGSAIQPLNISEETIAE